MIRAWNRSPTFARAGMHGGLIRSLPGNEQRASPRAISEVKGLVLTLQGRRQRISRSKHVFRTWLGSDLWSSRSPTRRSRFWTQEDIFFAAPAGRLKLRIFNEHEGELIHYHRADTPEPRASRYRIAPTSDPLVLKSILGDVLGVTGSVRKHRLVFHVGQTRVHLDRVEQLGDFLELEVVLRPDQPESEGVAIARDLLHRLGISPEQLVQTAYVDLLHTLP